MFTITFNQDTEITGVGTVIATQDGFSYSRRVNTDDTQDITTFCQEAKQKFALKTSKDTNIQMVESKIAAEINAL